MSQKKSPIVIAILIMVVALIAFAVPLATAAPRSQTQPTLNVGVIGPFDGPAAEGVTLAFERFMAQGPLVTPDNASYKLNVTTIDASTVQQVTDAVAQFKTNNVVAIFAPDDNQLMLDSMAVLQGSGVPVFTAATSTAMKGGGLIFRTRANEMWRGTALADYLATDLKKSKIAIYQGSPDTQNAVTELVTALGKRGITPAPVVVAVAGGTATGAATELLKNAPDTVIAFGLPTESAVLFRTLRGNNYEGIFVTPNAASRDFVEALPDGLRAGIYGVTGWSYASEQLDSADFLRDYVALFGNMPNGLSASAYDTAVALAIAIKNGGITPDGIHTALLKLAKAKSLQGTFNPALGNNDLTASVSITVSNRYGAPTVVARYEDTGRVPVADIQPTNYPTTTPTASPTPQGVVGTMKGVVNVRSGPGENYPVIGQLKKGEQIQLIGANTDFTWYVVDFRQQQGWINGTFVSVFGDVRSLPVVAAPPTPVPSATPVVPPTAIPPTVAPAPTQADIVLISAVMNPPTPISGQPFVLTVTVQNQGGVDAGPFAVATSFMPGSVFSAVNVSGLAAGATTVVNLPGTVTGSGTYTIDIVLDLNSQVDEGPNGEANNKPQFTYTVNP